MSNSGKLGRILALDIGKKRIGSAITDAYQLISKPYKIFEMKGSINQTLKEILLECEKEATHIIVAGYPLELNGEKGSQTNFTEKVIKSLVALINPNYTDFEISIHTPIVASPYTIHLIDERFTSVQAEQILSQRGLKNIERREEKDNISASILLETYLNRSPK